MEGYIPLYQILTDGSGWVIAVAGESEVIYEGRAEVEEEMDIRLRQANKAIRDHQIANP